MKLIRFGGKARFIELDGLVFKVIVNGMKKRRFKWKTEMGEMGGFVGSENTNRANGEVMHRRPMQHSKPENFTSVSSYFILPQLLYDHSKVGRQTVFTITE